MPDDETPSFILDGILALAHAENLTTYDAISLEMAIQLGLRLATNDKHLGAVGVNIGVQITPD